MFLLGPVQNLDNEREARVYGWMRWMSVGWNGWMAYQNCPSIDFIICLNMKDKDNYLKFNVTLQLQRTTL